MVKITPLKAYLPKNPEEFCTNPYDIIGKEEEQELMQKARIRITGNYEENTFPTNTNIEKPILGFRTTRQVADEISKLAKIKGFINKSEYLRHIVREALIKEAQK